jgi:hypothetical protein
VSCAFQIDDVNLVREEVANCTRLNLNQLFILHNVKVLRKVFAKLVNDEFSGFLMLVCNFADVLLGSS